MTKKNEARTKNHEAFAGIFGALRAVYEAEIERLTELYRSRILSGEFSGNTVPEDDPAHMLLEQELEETHPWTGDVAMGWAVISVSAWALRQDESPVSAGSGVEVGMFLDDGLRSEVAECMAHDILAAAIARGWVKGFKRYGPSYLLKVA